MNAHPGRIADAATQVQSLIGCDVVDVGAGDRVAAARVGGIVVGGIEYQGDIRAAPGGADVGFETRIGLGGRVAARPAPNSVCS